MQTTVETSNLTAKTLQSGSVVKNDTKASSKNGINFAKLKTAKKVTLSITSSGAPNSLLQRMEKERLNWETTELAASNKRLYSILKDVYSYYVVMKTDESKDVRKAHADELKKFAELQSYKFMESTHDMTRVVKCVFGVDRRRVSAYSIALREALHQNIDPEVLPDFIELNGGVEQIRLGGTKPLPPTKRAEMVKEAVLSNQIGSIKFDAKLVQANAEWNDKQVVIIATYLPTGHFEANAVVRHDGAVTAALAAYHALESAKAREAIRQEKKVSDEAEKQVAAVLKKAKTKSSKPQTSAEKVNKRKAKVKADIQQSKLDVANKAHFDSIVLPA